MRLQEAAAPRIHRIEDAYVNWYLVEEGGRFCVVDAGHPASWSSLEDALASLGGSLDDVDAVVLTHGHFDHVGFAERAREELAVPVWVHADDAALASEPWSYEHERSRLPYAAKHPSFDMKFAAMGAAGALTVRGVSGVREYGDAETLPVPGSPSVIHVPGHTHGSCALHYAGRDALIVGDAIVMSDPYTGNDGPRIVAGAATADSELALASLDRLVSTAARTVLTGHGEPWTNGIASAVEAAREAGPS